MTAVVPAGKRTRRTKVAMAELRQSIIDLVEANQPCTIRQIYYLGIGLHLWAKDAGGKRNHYNRVVDLVGGLREANRLPWDWIADNTRWVRRDTMYNSPGEALRRFAEAYRRDLWANQPRHIEVWCESDSIAGVIDQVTRPLGAGLYVCRGQASKTFVHEATLAYLEMAKPVTMLYVGDWDPTGLAIPRSLEERVERYGAGAVDINYERIALTSEDVASGLPGHPVNRKDKNYKRFATHCELMRLDPLNAVEVEALPPTELRQRLEDRLYGLIEDPQKWNATLAAEESEKEIFQRIARRGFSR